MVFDDEERTALRVDELIELMNLGDVPQLVRPRAVDRHAARASTSPAWSPIGRPSILLDEPSSGIAQREVEALAPVLLRLRDEMGASLVRHRARHAADLARSRTG